jgi:hypothetical protein
MLTAIGELQRGYNGAWQGDLNKDRGAVGKPEEGGLKNLFGPVSGGNVTSAQFIRLRTLLTA